MYLRTEYPERRRSPEALHESVMDACQRVTKELETVLAELKRSHWIDDDRLADLLAGVASDLEDLAVDVREAEKEAAAFCDDGCGLDADDRPGYQYDD